MSLNNLGILALIAAAPLAYASVVDRTSAWALSVVELDGQLPTPLWALLLGVGILLVGVSRLSGMARGGSTASAPGPVVRRRPVAQPNTGRDGLVQRIRALPLPAGARLLVDDPPTIPLHLIVEEAPEKRVRRAVGAVGVLLAGLPLPPRMRVSLRKCPEPLTPWHHIINAALAEHLPRSEYKVVSGLDGVDILFHRPGPGWKR